MKKVSRFDVSSFSDDVIRLKRSRNLEVDDVLFREGDSVESFFFVESGCVRLVVYPTAGKELVLYRARDKEVFAEEHLVQSSYGYTAIADLRTRVHYVPTEAVFQDLRSSQVGLERYLSCLSGRYLQLRVSFERLGIASARGRVLHFLEALSKEKNGEPLDLHGRVKSLSNDLNLTHEAFYRALSALERDGRITRDGGRISLVSATP